jgi:hypothetical protein
VGFEKEEKIMADTREMLDDVKREQKEMKQAVVALKDMAKESKGDLSKVREKVDAVQADLAKFRVNSQLPPAMLRVDDEEWNDVDSILDDQFDPVKRCMSSTRWMKRMEKGTERPEDELMEMYQKAHTALLICGMIARSKDKGAFTGWNKEWLDKATPRTSKRYWHFVEQVRRHILRADEVMDAGGDVSSWVPTQYAGRMYEKVRIALKVANLFEAITMPTPTYTLPLEGTDLVAYLGGELADDPGDGSQSWTISKSTVANKSLTAKKSVCRTVVADEATEDTIIPVIPYVERLQTLAHAVALENVLINGQATTAMDLEIGGGAIAANDYRKAMDGLRYIAKEVKTAATLDMGTFSETTLRSLLALMGIYAGDIGKLVFVTSLAGFFKFLELANIWTLDKYGPNAVILKGELGKWMNIPIVVSEYFPANLNASGVYDDVTTTKTGLLCARKDCFVRGIRHGFELKILQEVYAASGGIGIVSYQRNAFIDLWGAGDNDVVYGYNIG